MTTGGWTLSVFCIFGKGHLQVLDLCGAAQEWIYCERRKTRQFLIRSVFGEEEKSHRSLEFAGSLRLFAETSTAADTGRIGEIWGKETGKHREEVRWRVEEEADRMWRGGMGRGERRQHCMKNLPPPPTIKKKLSVVLHISEETQTTATPISPRSPATLPSALPRLVYIYVEALDPHVNNIR